MQSLDLNQGYNQAQSQISAIKDYNESSKAEKKILRSAGNSFSKSVSELSTQLNKISDKQKRFERNAPTSMDQLVNLFGSVNGQGPESFKYLRKKFIEASVKIGPEVEKIISEETIKALGCSQEQTYKGISQAELEKIPSLDQLPVGQGIYIPVSSIDILGNLKNSPNSPVGKSYYEKPSPSVSPDFKPFGGFLDFPMNKELYLRMDNQNSGRSFRTEYGKNYQGVSTQNLFDFQYTKTNEFGVTGDYFRVVLIDRVDENGNTGVTVNKVGQFVNDYFKTIKLVDPVNVAGQIVNVISGAVDAKAGFGSSQITNQSKFYTIAARILGLCFDSRREIDVSGISKIAELDGVDESFFEFTEIDLRNIDTRTSNVQNGVMEFEDCDNVKFPVDVDTLIDELVTFRDSEANQTPEQKVSQIESIIDSISQNPEWKIFTSNFNPQDAINKNVLKQIPLAVAAGVLTPKVLLPIYTMLSVLQTSAKNSANEAITTANSSITEANASITDVNAISNKTNNIVNNGVDFLKKFRTFGIQVISRIGGVFLRTLFDILKRDIINLLSIIISDITKSNISKTTTIIKRYLEIATVVAQLIQDYRKCKSLIDEILQILRLINGLPIKRRRIPASLLLAFSEFLPGENPDRATNNTIEFLQKVGVPTGTLPDGSPNFMNFFNKAVHRGADKERAENGVSDSVGLSPGGGLVFVSTKPR